MLRVETSNSTYEIDEEAGTVTRVPMSGDLRRDAEPVPLVALSEVEVGKPMRMVLDLRGDGVRTYRITSVVLRIESDFYEEDEPIEDIAAFEGGIHGLTADPHMACPDAGCGPDCPARLT